MYVVVTGGLHALVVTGGIYPCPLVVKAGLHEVVCTAVVTHAVV